jgi:hypothetical protein
MKMSDSTQNGTKTLAQALKDLDNPDLPSNAYYKINEPFFIHSILEEGFLYHTTPFSHLKKILRDGYLTGNVEHLLRDGVNPLHPNAVCFTTNKWRHLSNLPNTVQWFGITHDCYIQIPFGEVEAVKPVIYDISISEIEEIVRSGLYYYLSTLTQNLEPLMQKLGILKADLPTYLYNTWWSENEWRTKKRKVELPASTVIYVSNPQQRKVVEHLTNLPVEIDREVMQLQRDLGLPNRMLRKIIRIIGKDAYRHGTKHIQVYGKPVKRPDGSMATVYATLYDVPFLYGNIVVRRLEQAGLKVWLPPKAWKHRGQADLSVDLTCLKQTRITKLAEATL